MQDDDESEISYEEYKAKVNSVKKKLSISIQDNSKNKYEFSAAIELAIELNLSVMLARVPAAIQQRDFKLAYGLVERTLRIADDVGFDLQRYRCLFWKGVFEERSEVAEDRARAFSSFWEALPICDHQFLESLLLPLSLEKHLGQIRVQIEEENVSDDDRDKIWRDIHELVRETRTKLGLDTSDQTTVQTQLADEINGQDSRTSKWVSSQTAHDSSLKDPSIALARPVNLSVAEHIEAAEDKPVSPDKSGFTPVSEINTLLIQNPEEYDKRYRKGRQKMQQDRQEMQGHTRPSLSRKASGIAEQQHSTVEPANTLEHNESAAQEQLWRFSQSQRRHSLLHYRLFKDITNGGEFNSSEKEGPGDSGHMIPQPAPPTDNTASGRTAENTVMPSVNSASLVKSDSFEADTAGERPYSWSKTTRQDVSTGPNSTSEIRQSKSSESNPRSTFAESQKSLSSRGIQHRNSTGLSILPAERPETSIARGTNTHSHTVLPTQFQRNLTILSPKTMYAGSPRTPLSAASLFTSQSPPQPTESDGVKSTTPDASMRPLPSQSSTVTTSVEVAKTPSPTMHHKRPSESTSRPPSQSARSTSVESTSQERESLSLRPGDLSDALILPKIEDRVKITIGRRKASDTKLLAPIVTHPNVDSIDSAHSVQSPELRRSSVSSSSPLRESMTPEGSQ